MGTATAAAAPCYFTRVDLTDALGERLIRLQKRREKRRNMQQRDPVSEWWDDGASQERESVGNEPEAQEEMFVMSPAEQELTAQMAAMGLPTVLVGGSKHEARASNKAKRRKAKKATVTRSPEPATEFVTAQTPQETKDQQPANPEAVNGDLLWYPVWDSEHGAFYWFHSESQESQWEVPAGLEEYAAGLYAFGQEETAHGMENFGQSEGFGGVGQEEVTGQEIDQSAGDPEQKESVARREGAIELNGEASPTGPQVSGLGLRGQPRPCGKHIRFEDEIEACAVNGENGVLGDGKSGEGSELFGGVKESQDKGGARQIGRRLEEAALDLMEVDDPMDVDSCGVLIREINGSQRRGARTVGGDSKKKELERGSGGREKKSDRERLEGLGELYAAAFGERLLEAAQDRVHDASAPSDNAGIEPSKVFASIRERSVSTTKAEGPDAPALLADGNGRCLEGTSAVGSDVQSVPAVGSSTPEPDNFASEGLCSALHSKRVANADGELTSASVVTAMGVGSAVTSAVRSAAGARVTSATAAEAGVTSAVEEGVTSVAEAPMMPATAAEEAVTSAETGLTSATAAEAVVTSSAEAGVTSATAAVTSAAVLEADPGAGGDAGGAVLTASLQGAEKPADVGQKYWFQRYRLFSRFDEGVRLDPEGWYSVTPESIAAHHAKRCAGRVVIDAFAGVGGNAIQMATTADCVIAADLDPGRLALAEHNARVYGVRDKIEFVVGDFLKLATSMRADALFLSPPWGGPEYNLVETYNLDTMLEPVSGTKLFKAALQVTSNIALFLPRNVDVKQLQELAWLASPPLPCEIESNYLCGKLKCITAYYGGLVVAPPS